MAARETRAAGSACDRLMRPRIAASSSVSGRSGAFLRRDIGGPRVIGSRRCYPAPFVIASGNAHDPLGIPMSLLQSLFSGRLRQFRYLRRRSDTYRPERLTVSEPGGLAPTAEPCLANVHL